METEPLDPDGIIFTTPGGAKICIEDMLYRKFTPYTDKKEVYKFLNALFNSSSEEEKLDALWNLITPFDNTYET